MSRPSGQNRNHAIYLLANISAGLWNDYSPLNTPEGSAAQAENIVFNPDGSISSRPGYSPFANFETSSTVQQVVIDQNDDPLTLVGGLELYSNDNLIATAPEDNQFIQILPGYGRVFVVRGQELLEYRGGAVTFPTKPTFEFTAVCEGMNDLPPLLPAPYWEYTITGIDHAGYEVSLYTLRIDKCKKYDENSNNGISFVGSIPKTSHWQTFKLYRKDQTQPVPLYLRDVSKVDEGDEWALFVQDDYEQTTNARTIPSDELMVPGRLNCFSANRLWSIDGQYLRYSNPYNPLARNPFAQELFNLPNGELPTALVPYGQGVLIFGRTSVLHVTGAPLAGGQFISIQVSDGCVGPLAWAYAENQLFYAGQQHIYTLQGNQVTPITHGNSSLVRERADVSSQLVYVAAQRSLVYTDGVKKVMVLSFGHDQKLRTSLWNVTPNAVTASDGYLVGSYLEPSTNKQKLVRFNAARDYDYTFNEPEGKPIPFVWKSNPLSIGDPTTWKIFRRVEGFFTPEAGTSVTLGVMEVVGDGTAPQIGQSALAVALQTGALVVSSGIQGRFLQIIISGSSLQGERVIVAPPLSIQYRSRDRMGRS